MTIGFRPFDYLKMYEDVIILESNDNLFKDNPCNHEAPYGNIGKMVGTFSFVKFLKESKLEMQVIEFKTVKNYPLILKRYVTYCKIPSDSIFSDTKMRGFINSTLDEFVITRIISSHPAGIIAFEFKVTFVHKITC